MRVLSLRPLWPCAVALAAGAVLTGCSAVGDSTRSALYAITPYKVEVVQGNFVSKEQVDALKAGMTRQQAREILGTSLLSDVFHADRWDYVFTIRRQGVEAQQRRLTLFFKGEYLERFEGDPMPSEQEFVATLDARNQRSTPKVPKLEASEDELKKFQPDSKSAKAGEAPEKPLPPLPASYPPLESGR